MSRKKKRNYILNVYNSAKHTDIYINIDIDFYTKSKTVIINDDEHILPKFLLLLPHQLSTTTSTSKFILNSFIFQGT